jgi:hypothetical protein
MIHRQPSKFPGAGQSEEPVYYLNYVTILLRFKSACFRFISVASNEELKNRRNRGREDPLGQRRQAA